ncbi:hypothetical protein SynA18461_01913 [Synechococcus sp. A18-46.1]|nr:hypothetical protein SynA18461_01913 [Synechococcus sp. A18-46.1]
MDWVVAMGVALTTDSSSKEAKRHKTLQRDTKTTQLQK